MSDKHKGGVIEALDKLYEFEREPVSPDKLQPGRYFAGLFAGEHVAATEFVIGAMFVKWGASVYDIFIGLLIGNLMAVLTWTFICAPIAVQTRLTLYWYLRKIAGPVTTGVYNMLNAILFCILAGCMITVSASAVRIPFGIAAQTKWYPESPAFVLVVIIVGAVVVTLAILGFRKLAQFASVCSPWLFVMFVAGAIVTLPALAKRSDVGQISSFSDFWVLAKSTIWTGTAPPGEPQITFMQVAAFAWICNLAMHGGLSDMALFRYARKAWYGAYSTFGMLLGHYVAWICAGVMGAGAAVVLERSIGQLDAGDVAVQALGFCGAIAVVIAGWTTSNPTLYRAGMALQAATPGWPRWLVTLVAGIVTTVIACFPFVFTRLLNFVGYYGLLLMPVGAIVVTEHWIFPRIGFTRYWVEHKKLIASWPALLSWGIAIAVALLLEQTGTLHLFFLFVPVWVLTTVLYLLFCSVAGARERFAEKTEDATHSQTALQADKPTAETGPKGRTDVVLSISRIVAVSSLIACIALPIWVYSCSAGGYEQRLGVFKGALIWPSLIYFVSATAWAIRREKAK